MNKLSVLSIFFALMLSITGCVSVSSKHTSVDASKEAFTQTGFRYYLPQPFLMVTPSTEHAGVDVKPVMMPDYTRAYTIESHTIMAKSGLTIETDNGLLKVVKASGDPSATASAAIDAAGAIGVEMLKLEAAKSELEAAKEKAREEQLRENIDQIAAAVDALPTNKQQIEVFALRNREGFAKPELGALTIDSNGQYDRKLQPVVLKAPDFDENEKKILAELNAMCLRLRILNAAIKEISTAKLIAANEEMDLPKLADILNGLYVKLYGRTLKSDIDKKTIEELKSSIQSAENHLLQGLRLRPQLVMVDTSQKGVHLVPVELRRNDDEVRDAHHEHQILRTLPTPPKGDPKPDNYQRIDIHLPDLKNGIKAEIPEK